MFIVGEFIYIAQGQNQWKYSQNHCSAMLQYCLRGAEWSNSSSKTF